jgi:hypothetical protein
LLVSRARLSGCEAKMSGSQLNSEHSSCQHSAVYVKSDVQRRVQDRVPFVDKMTEYTQAVKYVITAASQSLEANKQSEPKIQK